MGNTNLKMYMKALWVNMLDEGTVPGTVHSNEFYEIFGELMNGKPVDVICKERGIEFGA